MAEQFTIPQSIKDLPENIVGGLADVGRKMGLNIPTLSDVQSGLEVFGPGADMKAMVDLSRTGWEAGKRGDVVGAIGDIGLAALAPLGAVIPGTVRGVKKVVEKGLSKESKDVKDLLLGPKNYNFYTHLKKTDPDELIYNSKYDIDTLKSGDHYIEQIHIMGLSGRKKFRGTTEEELNKYIPKIKTMRYPDPYDSSKRISYDKLTKLSKEVEDNSLGQDLWKRNQIANAIAREIDISKRVFKPQKKLTANPGVKGESFDIYINMSEPRLMRETKNIEQGNKQRYGRITPKTGKPEYSDLEPASFRYVKNLETGDVFAVEAAEATHSDIMRSIEQMPEMKKYGKLPQHGDERWQLGNIMKYGLHWFNKKIDKPRYELRVYNDTKSLDRIDTDFEYKIGGVIRNPYDGYSPRAI
jgi:hypothetical protein